MTGVNDAPRFRGTLGVIAMAGHTLLDAKSANQADRAPGGEAAMAANAAGAALRALFERALDSAEAMLRVPAPQRHRGIHRARKAIREARALLRLAGSELGVAASACDETIRGLGARLSDVRDAHAAVETYDRIAAKHRLPGDIRDALVRRRHHALQTLLSADPGLERLRAALADARREAAALPWPSVDAGALLRTFLRTADKLRRRHALPHGERRRHRLRRRLRRWQMQSEIVRELLQTDGIDSVAAVSAVQAWQLLADDAGLRVQAERARLLARERDLRLLQAAAAACEDVDVAPLRRRVHRQLRKTRARLRRAMKRSGAESPES